MSMPGRRQQLQSPPPMSVRRRTLNSNKRSPDEARPPTGTVSGWLCQVRGEQVPGGGKHLGPRQTEQGCVGTRRHVRECVQPRCSKQPEIRPQCPSMVGRIDKQRHPRVMTCTATGVPCTGRLLVLRGCHIQRGLCKLPPSLYVTCPQKGVQKNEQV